jgi:hypothetical protein
MRQDEFHRRMMRRMIAGIWLAFMAWCGANLAAWITERL